MIDNEGPGDPKSRWFANVTLFISCVFVVILLMEEILHQLIGSLSHYLQGFINARWCRISSINSIIVISSNPMRNIFFYFVGKPAIDVPFFLGGGSIYWFMIPDPFGQTMNSRNSSSANSDRQKCRKEVTGSGSDSEKVEVFWRKGKMESLLGMWWIFDDDDDYYY